MKHRDKLLDTGKGKYQYIFFDLDGTLTDPREGITKSVQYALRHMGIDETDLRKLEPFIGPPLMESFAEYYGFGVEDCRKCVEYYREYFSENGWKENLLFEGVRELLLRLREHGKTVAIASSKPEYFVRKILQYFEIDGLFDEICGATMGEERTKKEEVIEELLLRLGLGKADREKILMVGDRRHDVEGAKAFGIDCLGVAMGFAAEGELEKAGAVEIVESMEKVGDFVLQIGRG